MTEKQRKVLLWLVVGQLLCMVTIVTWVVGSDWLREKMGTIPFFGASGFLVLLGVVLAVVIQKYKVTKPLKIFLAMAGYSAAYFFPATVAHNFLSVGGERLGGILGGALSFLGAFFFITSVIGVPIALVIGAIGGLVLLLKKS